VFKQDAGDMANQNLLVRLARDRLDTVYHADVPAHLEGRFRKFEFNEFETLFANNFEKLLA
jgi:hypothetical protein